MDHMVLPANYTFPILSLVSDHQMAPPLTEVAYYSFIDPIEMKG